MASSSFNLHEPKADLTVTSGKVNFTITTSYAYRQGNHIHAEVYGNWATDVTTGTEVPFFTISGIKAPAANKFVGSVTIMGSDAKPIYSVPSLAQLRPNKYIYQRVTTVLSAGYRLGFIVDYVDD